MTKETMENNLGRYEEYLKSQERSEHTVRKYVGDLRRFCDRCPPGSITKARIMEYRDYLLEHYAVNSVNSYLISLNGYLRWLDCPELIVRIFRCQRVFCSPSELTRDEYEQLLVYAKKSPKYYYILRVLGATGIRIGELPFVTEEAVCRGFMLVYSKRKLRQVFFPVQLQEELQAYGEASRITSGVLFPGRGAKGAIHSSSVWRFLKKAATECGIEPEKVYPHNFRHLFARTYMGKYHNLAELADLLGHSSIETTRIYVRSTGSDKRRELNELGL